MAVTSTAAGTVWETGRFGAGVGRPKLLFGRMYEDAAIELAAFRAGGRIFCIASAGCTAIQLAAQHEVVAVDINPVQIAYLKRRLAGGNFELGSAERVLGFLRLLAPLVGWSRRIVRDFLDLDDPEKQILFWRHHLDTMRFRVAFALLFWRPALRLIYSARLLDCLPPKLGAVMRGRLERCFGLHPNASNLYARALFLGEAPAELILPQAGRIELHCADAADFLEGQPAGSFTGFSLSNILDGANESYKRRLFAAVRHAAAEEAVVVLRSFGESSVGGGVDRAADDRSMLWGRVEELQIADF